MKLNITTDFTKFPRAGSVEPCRGAVRAGRRSPARSRCRMTSGICAEKRWR